MKCLQPIMMYDTGKVTAKGKRCLTTKANPRLPFLAPIPVPCGKCSACLERRRKEWCVRLRLEDLVSDCSSFVTLTYRDNPLVLRKSDIQKFIKRLRHVERDYGLPMNSLRYFICGEYGKKHHRPHWHGLLFGVDFCSSLAGPYLVGFKEGYPIRSSSVLEKLWPYGFVTCDTVTPSSIAYVSKYVTKDKTISLKSQGLGRSPFVDVVREGRHVRYRLRELFLSRLDDGTIVLPSRGSGFQTFGIPSQFDRYIERCNPSLFSSVRSARRAFAMNLSPDFRLPSERKRYFDYLSSQENQKRTLDNET